jgi:3-methyladenine DNA glycosylase AlkC
MADALKHFFDKSRVEAIAAQLAGAWAEFPRAAFVREATAGLAKLELIDRGRHIAAALGRALPGDYPSALRVLVASIGERMPATEGNGMAPFHYLPHVIWVAERGVGEHAHVEASLAAQRELTQRFSCEWSIRPYLEQHPEATMAALVRWSADPDEHVRRLVSEGTRPRLPWAPRLRRFQGEPAPVLALLERLRDDESEYVRRSVANNLNDIAKDHPAVVVAVCKRWLDGASDERRRLVTHALRSLVKADHAEAIRLVVGAPGAKLDVHARVEPRAARIGGAVTVLATLHNPGKKPARAVVTARVHFVKARGGTSPRTFKLPTVEVAPGASVDVRKKISVAQHTTRTHFPGRHRVEVLVNGAPAPAGSFQLRR